jgi:predicted permease
MDWRVLAFCVAVLGVATVLIAVFPALRLSTRDIRGLLTQGGRSASGSSGSRRVLGTLVVAEISLAIVLVAGAGWLVRSYLNLSSMDLGFATEGRLLVDPMLPEEQAAVQGWMATAPDRLLALDVVSRLGSSSSLPLRPYYDSGWYVAVPGDDYDVNRQNVALRTGVSPGFFEAMGTPLLAGRTLTEADRPPPVVTRVDPETGQPETGTVDPDTGEFRPGPPPAVMPRVVVNRAFAEWYLPGRDPVGAVFGFGAPVVNFDDLQEIVGVVENIQYRSLRDEPTPVWYVPTALSPRGWIVETTLSDPADAIPTIRSALAQVDPSIQIDILPLSDLLSDAMGRHQLGLVLMSLFAAVSLALAAIGIFGVVAHSTAQRRKELATLIALGASPGKVVGILLSQARVLTAAGVILGLGAAYAGGRLATSRFHQVRAEDPAILLAAVVAVLGVTLLAFLVPALRAARIRPAEVLKGE